MPFPAKQRFQRCHTACTCQGGCGQVEDVLVLPWKGQTAAEAALEAMLGIHLLQVSAHKKPGCAELMSCGTVFEELNVKSSEGMVRKEESVVPRIFVIGLSWHLLNCFGFFFSLSATAFFSFFLSARKRGGKTRSTVICD